MDLTYSDELFKCPRCNHESLALIEHDGPDRIKCSTCQVYFHRVGWTYRFVSADGHKVFIDTPIKAEV